FGVVCLSLGLRSRLPFNVWPLVGIAGSLAALISPPILRRFVDLSLRWQQKPAGSTFYVSWTTVFGCAAALIAMYALQTIYSVLLADSIGLFVDGQWLLFMGAIFLSSIAGMVAFFSPGGIGVRELIFVQLLQPWYAKDQLLAFVIVWR